MTGKRKVGKIPPRVLVPGTDDLYVIWKTNPPGGPDSQKLITISQFAVKKKNDTKEFATAEELCVNVMGNVETESDL